MMDILQLLLSLLINAWELHVCVTKPGIRLILEWFKVILRGRCHSHYVHS